MLKQRELTRFLGKTHQYLFNLPPKYNMDLTQVMNKESKQIDSSNLLESNDCWTNSSNQPKLCRPVSNNKANLLFEIETVSDTISALESYLALSLCHLLYKRQIVDNPTTATGKAASAILQLCAKIAYEYPKKKTHATVIN